MKRLLQDCKNGDRKAQYQLYRHCFALLMGVCYRYKNQEEDAAALMNAGFLKILTNLDKYKPEIPFEAWAKRIMINTIIDEFRKNRKVRELIEYKDFSETDDFEAFIDFNKAAEAFDAEELENLIKKLPPVSQKVFNLYAIDGYKHQEISELLDISEGTSKWHLSFARKKLQEMLGDLMRRDADFMTPNTKNK